VPAVFDGESGVLGAFGDVLGAGVDALVARCAAGDALVACCSTPCPTTHAEGNFTEVA
jgi:hypothetical protein